MQHREHLRPSATASRKNITDHVKNERFGVIIRPRGSRASFVLAKRLSDRTAALALARRLGMDHEVIVWSQRGSSHQTSVYSIWHNLPWLEPINSYPEKGHAGPQQKKGGGKG